MDEDVAREFDRQMKPEILEKLAIYPEHLHKVDFNICFMAAS